MLIGYTESTKIWKLWDIARQRAIRKTDAVSIEQENAMTENTKVPPLPNPYPDTLAQANEPELPALKDASNTGSNGMLGDTEQAPQSYHRSTEQEPQSHHRSTEQAPQSYQEQAPQSRYHRSIEEALLNNAPNIQKSPSCYTASSRQ